MLNHIPIEIFITLDQTNFDSLFRFISIYSLSPKQLKIELEKKNNSIQLNKSKTKEYIENELNVIENLIPQIEIKMNEYKKINALNKIIQYELILEHFNSQKNILMNVLSKI